MSQTEIPQDVARELLEAAKDFAEAAAKEFNENGGASGWALARLTDLRAAITKATQDTGKKGRAG